MEAVRHLYEAIQERVNSWRRDRYPCAEYPAIGEILEYARLPEPDSLRFLRRPQLRALETYWYLRLIERTAKIPDLYRNYFTKPKDRLDALGIPSAHERVTEILAEGGGVDAFLRRVADDDSLVKDLKLESLRETLTLDYPSYIFALAMGAGKTILIGAIIATEFAMALEYPDGPFVQNALVFAPGKTILEALRELGDVPFDKVLPPRLYKEFAASLKLTFTRDGEKDLPVVRGSAFNVVVTNTEKIRIQKPTMRRVQGWTQIELQERERPGAGDREPASAGHRHLCPPGDLLGRGAPHLRPVPGHGAEEGPQDRGLPALSRPTCSAWSTPPARPTSSGSPCKDVVVWYGLSEGIRDGILKDVSGSIRSYSYATSDAPRFVSRGRSGTSSASTETCTCPNGAPGAAGHLLPPDRRPGGTAARGRGDARQAGPADDPASWNTPRRPHKKAEIDAFNRLPTIPRPRTASSCW